MQRQLAAAVAAYPSQLAGTVKEKASDRVFRSRVPCPVVTDPVVDCDDRGVSIDNEGDVMIRPTCTHPPGTSCPPRPTKPTMPVVPVPTNPKESR